MKLLCVIVLSLTVSPLYAKTAAKKASKDWSLLECGKDLKGSARAIDVYRKKLRAKGDPLSKKMRKNLYAQESVFAESLTLMTPEIFWKDLIATRVTKNCHDRFNSLVKSMSTNDSRGTLPKLNKWNQCVTSIYGYLPKQSQRINRCVSVGLKYIGSRQKAAAK